MENETNKGNRGIYSFLRWSEKWLKTDMVYLAKNSFWLSMGQISSSLSAFILSIAFAYILTPEMYGTYKYILVLCGVFSIFTLSGMEAAVVRSVSRGNEGTFTPALRTKIQWGSIAGFLSLCVGIYYMYKGNMFLASPFFIAAAFIPFMDPLNLYLSFLQGKKDFRTWTKYISISYVFTAATILIALLITKNILVIIATYFISWTLVRFVFLKVTFRKYQLSEKIDTEDIKYGKHLSLMNGFSTLADYLDRLLLFQFVGPAEVAIYSIAAAPVEQVKAFLKQIHILALPKLADKNQEEAKKIVRGKILQLLLILTIIVLIYILIVPFFFKIFFPKYLGSIFFSQIYAISLIGVALYLPYTSLEATASTKELYYYNTFTSAVQIISLLILTPLFSILGVVIARIISRFFDLGLAMYMNRKITV